MKLRLLIITAFLWIVPTVSAQYVKVLGVAEKSGTTTVSGIASTNKPSITFPLAIISIYSPTGSGVLATIYSDASGTTKANSYSADSSGIYDFFIQPGVTFDVRIAPVGTGVPAPFTRSGYTAAGLPGQTLLACAGSNDTSLLSAANSLGGTLVVPRSVTCAANSVTISAALEIQNGGLLKPNTGQTVTLTGPQNDGVWQKFTNVTLGTISFSGNKSVPSFYPQWFGVTGNGSTDDTATMQAFLNAMQNGFRATLTAGISIKHTGLTITHLANFVLSGAGGDGNTATGMPTFVYTGANGGTDLRLISCRGVQLSNLAIFDFFGNTTDGPDKSIWLDQDSSGIISSRNTIKNVRIDGNKRVTYRAINVNNSSASNNEQHILDNVRAVSYGYYLGFGLQTGTGLYLGHSNVKEVTVRDCSFLGFAKGIEGISNPSFYSYNSNYTLSAIAFFGSFSDTCLSIGDHGEGGTQVISAGVANFLMLTPRFADLHGGQAVTGTTTDDPVFDLAIASMEVRGGTFASVGAAFTSDFLRNNSPGNGSLTWKHNIVTMTTANLIVGLNTNFQKVDDDVRGTQSVQGAFVFTGTNTNLSGATPDVAAGSLGAGYSVRYGFNNGGTPATVTNFLNGFNGQLLILVGDTTTSIANGSTIKTATGATIPPWTSSKVVFFYLDGTVWRQIGNPPGQLAGGEGATLTISSNTIAPTNEIHQVGAGLIKTITVPAGFLNGTIALIPTAAFTTDQTGNIASSGTTAVIGKTMFATYSSGTSKWYLSY